MPVVSHLRALARIGVTLLAYGGRRLWCPVCGGRFRRMKPFHGTYFLRGEQVDHFTPDSLCPGCGSDIRHRLIVRFLRTETGLLRGPNRVLHFAPETRLRRILSSTAGVDYVPCDIDPASYPCAQEVDITSIPFPEASFDAIVCIHVLEHVPAEAKAIAELHRVLRPGGWALLAVPTYGDTTLEGTGLDDAGRTRMFGRPDHVRLTGLDLRGRLEAAGFAVTIRSIDDVPGNYVDRTIRSPHVDSDRYLFFCRKKA